MSGVQKKGAKWKWTQEENVSTVVRKAVQVEQRERGRYAFYHDRFIGLMVGLRNESKILDAVLCAWDWTVETRKGERGEARRLCFLEHWDIANLRFMVTKQPQIQSTKVHVWG